MRQIAIGYVRVSTTEQVQSGLGLADQRQRIAAHCTARGLNLGAVYDDNGVSGGKPLATRTGGAKLLKALRRRDTRAVVMLKLDRGFRNAADCLATAETWERGGISLHVVDLGGNSIDTSSAAGRFMLCVLAGAAEMERNLTCERTRAALAVKRGRGERTGTVPYGWELADDGVALLPVDAEQGIIADIRAMRADGWSFRRIAAELNQRGVLTKKGVGEWGHQAIASILRRAGLAAEVSSG